MRRPPDNVINVGVIQLSLLSLFLFPLEQTQKVPREKEKEKRRGENLKEGKKVEKKSKKSLAWKNSAFLPNQVSQ